MSETERRLRPTLLSSVLQPWADVGEQLHRRLIDFGNCEEGWEVLWVGPGSARAAAWWASRSEGHVSAVDPSPDAIGLAERAIRSAGLASRVTLQAGHASDLPHTEAVFDLVVIMALFDPDADPATALTQAAHVVRPMQPVVAALPVWTGSPVEADESPLAQIGVRPRFLAAWKQAARDAGLVEVTAETAVRGGRWLADGTIGPVARGFYAARMEGARTVLSQPVRRLRRLAKARTLELAVVRGIRWPAE